MVLAGLEVVAHAGHDVQAGQALQRVALALQPGHGVGAVGHKPGVGPCLLQHHALARAGIGGLVDPAAVGEVQGLVHPVGQVGDRGRVAGFEVRGEEVRQAHPGRDREDRRAPVGDQLARGVREGRDEVAAGVLAVPLSEAAVPDVERPTAVPQVAQDVRPVLAADEAVEFGEYPLARGIVPRIDRRELPARAARRVLGIPDMQGERAAQELERDIPWYAIGEKLADHAFRIVVAGGYVDFPALRGYRVTRRHLHLPLAHSGPGPAGRQRLVGDREVPLGRPAAIRGVVEQRVSEAEQFVSLIH